MGPALERRGGVGASATRAQRSAAVGRRLAVLEVVAELERLAERPAEAGQALSHAVDPPASAAPIRSGPSTV